MADRSMLWSLLAFAAPRRRAKKVVAEPAAVAGVRAMPVNFSPTDEEKIMHALYRLDAMKRHTEQTRYLSAERSEEFRKEARIHLANLQFADRLTDEEVADYNKALNL